MIVLGLVLLVVGYLLPMPALVTIGIILLIVGAVFYILGYAGHPIAGRNNWW